MTGSSGAAIRLFDYGPIFLLRHCLRDLHLDRHLPELFPETEAAMVIALAFNRLIRPATMPYIDIWYAETALALDNPALSLSDREIGELLKKIGTSDIPDILADLIIEENETRRALVYDITSLSGSSSPDHGYSQDSLLLPPITLSLVVDEDRGIPVMYDIYPGSITDSTTLAGTLARLEACGVTDCTAILESGFFSSDNLLDMLDEQISFVIAARFSMKELRALITREQRDIARAGYIREFHGRTIHVKPVVFALEGRALQGYLYYDPGLEQEAREAFTRHLDDIRAALFAVRLKPGQIADHVFSGIAGEFGGFFDCKQVEDRIEATIRQSAVTLRTNRMGRYMLFYQGNADWMTCLSRYRERDCIEEEFERLKGELEALPLEAHGTAAFHGYLFIVFLSLMLRSRLARMLEDAGLAEMYSVEGVMLELEKWKKIILADGRVTTTRMTRKQRMILKALGLVPLPREAKEKGRPR